MFCSCREAERRRGRVLYILYILSIFLYIYIFEKKII